MFADLEASKYQHTGGWWYGIYSGCVAVCVWMVWCVLGDRRSGLRPQAGSGWGAGGRRPCVPHPVPPPVPPRVPPAEYRISVYGRKPVEWDTLAAWVVQNRLYSDNNMWMIQVGWVVVVAGCVHGVGGVSTWGGRQAGRQAGRRLAGWELPSRAGSCPHDRAGCTAVPVYRRYRGCTMCTRSRASLRTSSRLASSAWVTVGLHAGWHGGLRCRLVLPPCWHCMELRRHPTPGPPASRLPQLLANIFTPLFEVTRDPNSHPQLHLFLRGVSPLRWARCARCACRRRRAGAPGPPTGRLPRLAGW